MCSNKKILISIIIPVWNPGQGISRCIDSLRNQTLEEIEMIFVDDCGTDNSMDEVRSAAVTDPRIRIIENEENIGAGPSRNKGIEVARGEYLSFVDPDDYIATNFYELLYAEASKNPVDIVKGSIKYEKEDGSIAEKHTALNQHIRTGLTYKRPLFNLFIAEHQSAVYRRAFLISSRARYGISRRGQDTTFLLRVCSQCNSFSMVDEACYYFCERTDSAMHRMNLILLQGCLDSISEKIDYFLQNQSCDIWTKEYLRRKFLYYITEGFRYQNNSETKDYLAYYSQALRSELLRIPFYKDLINDSFSIRILNCAEELLPIAPYAYPCESPNPPIQYADLSGQWVNYYLHNPMDNRYCLKDLITVLVGAKKAVRGIPTTTYSKGERKQGKKLLRRHIKKLPILMRLQISARTLVAIIAAYIPLTTKEALKKVFRK